MFKVVEMFSGIGAQAKALERLNINYEIVNTCDWDIGAILAYCLIHKGRIAVEKYGAVSDIDVDGYLRSHTLSTDGKTPVNERTYSRISADVKRMIYAAIQDTGNFVSITDVKGSDICENADLLTYSFPCQDLSMCGYWHGSQSGIDREAHSRSGMLWEVERILKEMHAEGRRLPRFLVMENVTNILSSTHRTNFNEWKNTLEELGYFNKVYRLNAKYFGVPQKRERAYMVSILYDKDIVKNFQLGQYFEDHDLERPEIAERYSTRSFQLKDVLKLDYTKKVYRAEADANQPNDTPSREKILYDNDMLFDGVNINEICVNTVTTKQDRNPNSGLITYHNGVQGKTEWRYLTPRECFILMGFDEQDYDSVISCNLEYLPGKSVFTNEKLIKLAGNSICVDVLQALFRQIIEIDSMLFSADKDLYKT